MPALGSALLTVSAPVAQRIEHLTTDQKVGSSSLSGRARFFKRLGEVVEKSARRCLPPVYHGRWSLRNRCAGSYGHFSSKQNRSVYAVNLSTSEITDMVRRLPKRDRIVPFRKPPVCYPEEPEMGARWPTLLAAVADIHAIIIRCVLSKSMRAARQLPPGRLCSQHMTILTFCFGRRRLLFTCTAAIPTALPLG